MCFDILHVDGRDLIADPYVARAFAGCPSNRVLGKTASSTCLHARNGAWLNAKHPHARDLQADRSTWTPRERTPIDAPLISYL